MVTLRIASLDDEPEEKIFPTIDEAVAYAKSWFLEGYENDTIDETTREYARERAGYIEQDLRSGGRFICNMFYEDISIVEGPRDTTGAR